MKRYLAVGGVLLSIVVVGLLLAGAFYWFSWRPTEIRKNCFQNEYSYVYYPTSESNRPVGNEADFNFKYLECVRFNGLPN
jgi:hypothetical protein